MRAVKSRHTRPELLVRRVVRQLGYRYRLHASALPGTPDIVIPTRKKAVLIHGCFWHQHTCRRGNRKPASNPQYWLPKLARNVARDRDNIRALRKLGWQVLTVWECQIGEIRTRNRIARFLRA